ncbi:MAG: hypothetical protein ACO1OG_07780 [Devosia sp.]
MMRRVLLGLLFSTLLVTAPVAQAQNFDNLTSEQIETQAADLHPAALYLLASRLLAEGRGQDAANWMYAGQIRYRFLLLAKGAGAGDSESVLFSALSEQVGRPVNEYIAGSVDEWLGAIDWALAWDKANPNGTTSKTRYAAQLEQTRTGLLGLRQQIEDNRDTIPIEREANGLPNR